MDKLKTTLKLETKYGPIYTGGSDNNTGHYKGHWQVSQDGAYFFGRCDNAITITSIATGKEFRVIDNRGKESEEDNKVLTFCVSPDDEKLVLAGEDKMLKQWAWKDTNKQEPLRKWKAIHPYPIATMAFDATSTLLATGAVDGNVRVWNIELKEHIHIFKGHTGFICLIEFHPTAPLLITSGSMDYNINVWSLTNSRCVKTIPGAHTSQIMSLQVHESMVYTIGRDKNLACWNLPKEKPQEMKKMKNYSLLESMEGMVLLSPGEDFTALGVPKDTEDVHCVTAGEDGLLKVWNCQTGQHVFTQQTHGGALTNGALTNGGITNGHTEEEESEAGLKPDHIIGLSYTASTGTFNVVTSEQNISILSKDDLKVKKQLVGFNDDIVDLKYMGYTEETKAETHVAVATNSSKLKIYDVATWSCQVLEGHTESILCMDVHQQGSLLVTSSKDKTIRLWSMVPGSNGSLRCIAIGVGHTFSVSCVAFSQKTASFLVSGSSRSGGDKDSACTIKLWPVPTELDMADTVPLKARFSIEKAHTKDINMVAVAPNDKLIASGSMDKTAKIWDAGTMELLGTLKGHKRGVCCVAFSPVDLAVATSSADSTIKIWSLTDYACQMTFDGHEGFVLRLAFINKGMQLLSCGSDCFLKLWNVKATTCVQTLDEHENRIWALEVNRAEDTILTAGSDSNIIFWKDMTEREREEKVAKETDLLLKDQELSNLLLEKKWFKAIKLAITLDQPFKVLTIIEKIMLKEQVTQLYEVIDQLNDAQMDSLIGYCASWNKSSRHSEAAQTVLQHIFRSIHWEDLLELPTFRASLEALLPYTERHAARHERLVQNAMIAPVTLYQMRPVAGRLDGWQQFIDRQKVTDDYFDEPTPKKVDSKVVAMAIANDDSTDESSKSSMEVAEETDSDSSSSSDNDDDSDEMPKKSDDNDEDEEEEEDSAEEEEQPEPPKKRSRQT